MASKNIPTKLEVHQGDRGRVVLTTAQDHTQIAIVTYAGSYDREATAERLSEAYNAHADYEAALEEIAQYFDWNDLVCAELGQLARDTLAKHKEQTP